MASYNTICCHDNWDCILNFWIVQVWNRNKTSFQFWFEIIAVWKVLTGQDMKWSCLISFRLSPDLQHCLFKIQPLFVAMKIAFSTLEMKYIWKMLHFETKFNANWSKRVSWKYEIRSSLFDIVLNSPIGILLV